MLVSYINLFIDCIFASDLRDLSCGDAVYMLVLSRLYFTKDKCQRLCLLSKPNLQRTETKHHIPEAQCQSFQSLSTNKKIANNNIILVTSFLSKKRKEKKKDLLLLPLIWWNNSSKISMLLKSERDLRKKDHQRYDFCEDTINMWSFLSFKVSVEIVYIFRCKRCLFS